MTKEERILEQIKNLIQGTEWESKVYLVGGAVRDEVMGKSPKDLDFVIEGKILSGISFARWLSQRLPDSTYPVIYPKYGTAQFTYDGVMLEFVAPRIEKYTEGSRKPIVSDGTLLDDAMRRDLTINSLMRNISTGEVKDLTGKGVDDIKNGIIRTPSDPDIIFKDDPLRMLRAIRFTVKYNFKIGNDLLQSIRKNAEKIQNISQERIRDEINKILETNNPAQGIQLLKDTGLLSYVIEEFNETIGMTQNQFHKDDVFQHTMSVLQNTPPDLKTRLIALFHDIGKVLTKSVTPEGSVHFYEHERASEQMVRNIMSRLKYPNELIDAVALGVRHHMALKHGNDDASQLSDKSLRKFVATVGDHLENILDVIHADNISHADESVMRNQIGIVRQRIEALGQQIDKSNIKLPINGNDILTMGIKQGPLVGKILSAVQDAWYENPNITREEAMKIAEKIRMENEIHEIRNIMGLK